MLFLEKSILSGNDFFVDVSGKCRYFLDLPRQIGHSNLFGSFGPYLVVFGMIGIVPEPVNEQLFEFSPHVVPIGSIRSA